MRPHVDAAFRHLDHPMSHAFVNGLGWVVLVVRNAAFCDGFSAELDFTVACEIIVLGYR